MVFLKYIKTLIFLFISFAFIAYAQPGQNILESAFSHSYTREEEGDFTGSINALEKIYDESSYEINLRLGWLYYNAGLFDESTKFYSKAHQLLPYSEEARFGLILPKSALGQWDEVVKLYQEILDINPKNTKAMYGLGVIYYSRKDYNKAYFLFKKVVDLYPFGYDGLLMLAWTHYFQGNYNRAKVLFYKVKLNNPDDESANEGLQLLNSF